MWRKKSLALSLAGIFLLLDQTLKYVSTNVWQEKILLNKFFGWQPFANTGAAFGLPVPMAVITVISILIITLFIFLLTRDNKIKNDFWIFGFLSLATAGAISNLIDRIFYGHTVDYILIFTGIINLADVLIVAGIVGYVWMIKNESDKLL